MKMDEDDGVERCGKAGAVGWIGWFMEVVPSKLCCTKYVSVSLRFEWSFLR
jgi:hypothetical protein